MPRKKTDPFLEMMMDSNQTKRRRRPLGPHGAQGKGPSGPSGPSGPTLGSKRRRGDDDLMKRLYG